MEKKIGIAMTFFLSIELWLSQIRSHEVRGTSRRGQRRSRKPSWALRSRGSGGGKQPAFRSVRSSRTGCLARHAGHRGFGRKGAGSLDLQGVSTLRGTGAAWKRGPPGRTRGAILAIRRGARRWNAPPVFAGTHDPSRGDAGTLDLSGGPSLPSARLAPRCGHDAREDSASRSGARTTNEVCGTGSRRGLARRKTARTLARVGPVPPRCFSGSTAARLVSPYHPREGADEGEGSGRFVLSRRSTRNRCGSWWCPCVVVLQKSAERPRAQRSASPVAVGSKACTLHGAREREPDHRRRSARERRRPRVAKGGRFREPRRSSSRERRESRRTTWFRSCSGANGMRVVTAEGRHLGRGCVRLSRGPRGTGLGGLRATGWDPPRRPPHPRARRRRQGCQRRTDSARRRGKRTPPPALDRAPKWETRREARFPPVSFAAEGPEFSPACSNRLRTGGAAREADVRVVGHGAARLRDESRCPLEVLKGLGRGIGGCAGRRRSTSARVGTVSECRSRPDAPPVATPADATQRPADTRDPGRRNRGGPTRPPRGARTMTVRGPVHVFPP